MVETALRQNIRWMSPSPLWGERSAWIRLPRQKQLTLPIILRFANDTFMDEMLAMLNHSPWRFQEWVARPETWREPMPCPKPIAKTRPDVNLSLSYNKTKVLLQRHSKKNRVVQIKQLTKTPAVLPEIYSGDPIKLYQAAHQRYYVVTASLVSEEKSYPDYLLNLSNNERATFVVRALVLNSKKGHEKYDEYAFVTTPTGMAWRKVGPHGVQSAAAQRVVANEEKLPLFPITYSDHCDRHRQLLCGLIPVGKREEWIEAPAYDGKMDYEIANPVPASDSGIDHYKEVFYSDVIGPWKALMEQAEIVQSSICTENNHPPNFDWSFVKSKTDNAKIMQTTRDEIQTGSWYVLLDFAKFLSQHLPRVWSVLTQETSRKTLTSKERGLVDALHETKINTHLFLELAIENLIVGGFVTRSGISLWDRLLELWRLEIYLKLARVLHESDSYSDLLLEKVDAHEEISDIFKFTFRTYFIQFQIVSQRTLLDFAKKLGEVFPGIKNVAIGRGGLIPQSNEWYLVEMLKEIYLPVAHRNIFQAIERETSGVIEIDKSLWGLLSTFWTIEEYFDHSLGANIANRISQYLHAHDDPILAELDEEVLAWFYGEAQGGDWYSFLDFANDLEKNCPALQVAAVFEAFNKQPEWAIDDQTQDLINTLKNTEITDNLNSALYYSNIQKRKIRIIHSLAAALVKAYEWEDELEKVTTPYDRSLQADNDYPGIAEQWPDFLFPLADPEPSLSLKQSMVVSTLTKDNSDDMEGMEFLQFQLDELADLVDSLVPKESDTTGAISAMNIDPLLDQRNPRFVVRCVFERPNCGALFQPLVSQATCQLEMAPFFDPDAPARSVRIRMPLDITPAGLRKYKKNAMFLISDMLCGKLKKIKKLTLADLVLSVLPWPFHKDLPNIGKTGPCRSKGETFGMFCSLSIPIVTLCALILMIIMVNLFNIFFKWIPYLFTCFPLPGLKGKKG